MALHSIAQMAAAFFRIYPLNYPQIFKGSDYLPSRPFILRLSDGGGSGATGGSILAQDELR